MISKLYILLPVHNRREITRKFVECLTEQTISDYHLVLIDDGSTDGTAEMVREYIPSATVLQGKGNWWWAGSLQQGLNWLKKHPPMPSDVVLIINDDVTFKQDFLGRGISFIRKFPRTLLLAQIYYAEEGELAESAVTADFRQNKFTHAESQEAINCLGTRGLFLSWEDLEKIGGFHPLILPHYGSDYEFTIRANRKGYALRTSPDVYLVPNLRATGIQDINSLDNVKMLFSRKCVMNPIYLTSFILLAFPVRWIPINLARVWIIAFKIIVKKMLT